ncbi:GntR family transcriptional regulator [Ancylobacter amanitiformis]|uniref:DNA-binding GntR family transcriptional regulator n=1 Tax=Ancylobacter amanitiformis TaxID=217069 RepID=A0ABU0LKX4_9HYPH|nr:GntR family transcriptional regulator [Ancylobacter amanitiformis]MDQ0509352.1 DNA-binding GntR family transcriptional regulator [Ancylobacter amanitiformis]
MEKLTPIDVSTLQERVYFRLREAISQGDFAPGATLTIRTLAASLGTSAMPVREALKRLVAEKVLEQRSNRSVAVPQFTMPSFRELIRIRMTIESLATRWAARRADPELLDHLRQLNALMAEAIDRGESEKVLDANRRFHFAIYAAADMPQLLEIIKGLWLRTGPYLGAAYRMIPGAQWHFLNGTRVHARIIEAMSAGNADRAANGIAMDIWFTARRFRPTMERLSGAIRDGEAETALDFAQLYSGLRLPPALSLPAGAK